jgi:hypothetical protein
MSAHSQLASEILWGAQPVLQLAVAVVLWRRKLYKQFPVFCFYLLSQIVIFAITFPLRQTGNYEWFFWSYWLGAAVSSFLCFKVIHEVFLDVFRPYHTLKDLGTVLFKWAGVVMLMISVVVAFSNSSQQDPLVNAVTTLQRSVRLVQCGLILFLLLFSRFLGVSRKQQSFGIALGFGLFAFVELLAVALNSGSYLDKYQVAFINTVTYNLVILIWFSYALARSTAREAAVNHLQTQRWEQSLANLHPVQGTYGAGSNSLIPMFEGMVERAISRTSNLEDGNQPAETPRRPSAPSPRTPNLPAAAAAGSKGHS